MDELESRWGAVVDFPHRITPGAKTPLSTDQIRKGYYEYADGVVGFRGAVENEPGTRQDRKLVELVRASEKALKNVWLHLEANYIWD